jgi:hypothetical protein
MLQGLSQDYKALSLHVPTFSESLISVTFAGEMEGTDFKALEDTFKPLSLFADVVVTTCPKPPASSPFLHFSNIVYVEDAEKTTELGHHAYHYASRCPNPISDVNATTPRSQTSTISKEAGRTSM